MLERDLRELGERRKDTSTQRNELQRTAVIPVDRLTIAPCDVGDCVSRELADAGFEGKPKGKFSRTKIFRKFH